jgi:hypothetical protein
LFDLYTIKTDIIKLSENEKVSKLKEEYMKINNFDNDKIRIRLFFGGTELKDNDEIFKYKIKHNFTVQVNKIEIE